MSQDATRKNEADAPVPEDDLTAVDPPLCAPRHESLADALVSNLRTNAVVHNNPDGSILIRITTSDLTISKNTLFYTPDATVE